MTYNNYVTELRKGHCEMYLLSSIDVLITSGTFWSTTKRMHVVSCEVLASSEAHKMT